MDADTILRLRPMLTDYFHEFDACMGQVTNRRHLDTYVSGQLSDLDRKSVEPIADAAGVAPRTLQEFLSLLKWDEQAARDELQQRVAHRHPDPHSIGVIDETSYHKQGRKTACVQRQYCGSRGKLDNCVVSVQLGYVAGEFHTLLDGEPFLPAETWGQDRDRCREAGIPDNVVYRSKWEIARHQIQRALGNGVRFSWLTFDAGYGGKPPFLRALESLGQNYVAEIPVHSVGWSRPPEVLYRELGRDKRSGRRRKLPRLKVRNTPACEVRNLLACSPRLRKSPWVQYRVKDGEKGPMIWEAKCVPFWIKDENGLPSRPHRLLITRKVTDALDVKFFLSNASASTPIESLLLVAFSRWRIERMFEDSKTELGLDHFEVRKYPSIVRHLILTCISHSFLAEFCLAHRGKKSGVDRRPGSVRHPGPRAAVVARRPGRRSLLAPAGRKDRRAIGPNPETQSRRPPLASQANHPGFTPNWHTIKDHTHLQVATVLAL